MRKFIRHPSDIPIEVECGSATSSDRLSDVGFGGLCFNTAEQLTNGSIITIRINVVKPPFEILARVVWHRYTGESYETGVEFIGEQDAYKARMVEQVCHIQHYRQQTWEREGRELTSKQAALEWIERYAEKFPSNQADEDKE